MDRSDPPAPIPSSQRSSWPPAAASGPAAACPSSTACWPASACWRRSIAALRERGQSADPRLRDRRRTPASCTRRPSAAPRRRSSREACCLRSLAARRGRPRCWPGWRRWRPTGRARHRARARRRPAVRQPRRWSRGPSRPRSRMARPCPASPVTDTVKRSTKTAVIVDTPDRAALRAVQTPQAFRFDLAARRAPPRPRRQGRRDSPTTAP